MLSLKSKRSGNKTEDYLRRLQKFNVRKVLEKYAKKGSEILSDNTPVDSGLTAASWRYVITNTGNSWSIEWHNDNVNQGCNIAVLLQYGHGLEDGGFVTGIDYINPALKPIFDELTEEVWREVKNL